MTSPVLLEKIRQLPPDTKAERLRDELDILRADGYPQTMVFTQYTDTMDFLRDELAIKTSLRVMCFSGRGGEVREKDGRWRVISREEAKQLFRSGKADVLLCTDAAAEGLNFQFCGSLINYDMPWNPMQSSGASVVSTVSAKSTRKFGSPICIMKARWKLTFTWHCAAVFIFLKASLAGYDPSLRKCRVSSPATFSVIAPTIRRRVQPSPENWSTNRAS